MGLEIFTLQTVQQFWVANVLVGPVAEALVVSFAPGVHLSTISQSHRELTSTAHFHDV